MNEQCEDASQLLRETRNYLEQVKEPKVTYTASVIDLYAFGRSWEGVGVGDDVAIIDKGFSEEGIRLQGRVSKIDRNLLTGDAKVTFGNLSDSMADMWQGVSSALQGNSQQNAIYDAAAGTSVSWLNQLMAALNERFNAVGTYKVETFELGTMWSNVPLDTSTGLPVRSTSNMWAVNINGAGMRLASKLKSNGQWDWRTFLTGAQVSADAINTGTMSAERVRTGILTDAHSRNTWDLNAGKLTTNSMTANNISANGSFECGLASNLLRVISGAVYGMENGKQIGKIDFSAHSYNIDNPEIKYQGVQITADGTVRISTPQISTAVSNNQSTTATICYTGDNKTKYISDIRDNGDGTVSWTWKERSINFKNGLCTYCGFD